MLLERSQALVVPARRRWLEGELVRSWRAWGYREVATPVWQPWDEVNAGRLGIPDQACKVLDPQGQVLALRPDMTIPIARMAAGELADEPRPLRLFYLGDIFRRSPRGGLETHPQAGLELIGSGAAAADAEVLALAAETLHDLGLRDFRLAIGHVAVLQAVLDAAGLAVGNREAVLNALQRRDYVVLERVLAAEPGLDAAACNRLFRLLTAPIGGAATSGALPAFLAEAGVPKAGPVVDNLRQVLALLEAYGLAQYATLELGLVRDLNYYTGLVFEASCPGEARPLGGGGRYDSLVGQFGRDEPATGFAFEAGAVLRALEARGLLADEGMRPAGVLVAAEPGAMGAAWTRARALRREGNVVEIDVDARLPEQALGEAARRGIPKVILVSPAGGERLLPAGDVGMRP